MSLAINFYVHQFVEATTTEFICENKAVEQIPLIAISKLQDNVFDLLLLEGNVMLFRY